MRSYWVTSALWKALHDDSPGDYALRTRSGEVFRFRRAAINEGGEWIIISDFIVRPSAYAFAHGIDVALDAIEWFAESPEAT